MNRFLAPLSQCPAFPLQPARLMFAWSGVLVLAYQPLPAALLQFKQQLERSRPDLKAENPGSRWPKTTLAVPIDEAPLTASTAQALQAWSQSQPLPELPPLWISEFVDLRFACRSLERYQPEATYPLLGTGRDASLALGDLKARHRQEVEQVWLASQQPEYWRELCRPGNHLAHYRAPANGRSLITWLPRVPAWQDWLQRVQQSLELCVPGQYQWLAPDSRHLTLRALDPVTD